MSFRVISCCVEIKSTYSLETGQRTSVLAEYFLSRIDFTKLHHTLEKIHYCYGLADLLNPRLMETNGVH